MFKGARESNKSVNEQLVQSEQVATAVTQLLDTSKEISRNILSAGADAAKSSSRDSFKRASHHW